MQKFLLVLPEDERPKVVRIAEAIRRAIQDNRLKPGEKIPPSRNLAHDCGVHRQTVMQALESIRKEGWIVAKQRKGYRVSDILPHEYYANSTSQALNHELPSLLSRSLSVPTPEGPGIEGTVERWNFRSGRSDLRLFPLDELKASFAQSLRRRKEKVLDYGYPEGHPPLIHELKAYLRLVRSIKDRDILITNGCQEALHLTASLLLKPGDVVAIENLSYPLAIMTLQRTGAVCHPLDMDTDGLIPEALQELCQRVKVKLLFLTPNHQFPTTVTMSTARRKAIYELAARHSVLILEDDYDHEYHYSASPPAPLATDDPEGLVIYASSLSKIMFPSARIGFLVLPRGAYQAFINEKTLLSIQNSLLLQDAIAYWMRSGRALNHLNQTRIIYQKRLEQVQAFLESEKNKGLDLEWKQPAGGMALWIKTPWNTTQLAQLAQRHGILIHDECSCRVDGREGPHLRIGFARHNEKEMTEGLSALLALGRTLP
ncbi:MAG: PLP-dependent aminotransferase family protein [Pseudobdellovibrionaceae bacterium]|nr:PLP-dependent aminotransferase family protein [Pseudobdellovibrionaceae bacterium]